MRFIIYKLQINFIDSDLSNYERIMRNVNL